MKHALIPVVLGAALFSGACSREQANEARETTQQAAQTTVSAADDAWTTTKVEAKFFGSPEVKGRHIDVTTDGGVVTLQGRVDTEAVKQQALALARETDGVREVRDQLEVAPAGTAATTGSTPPPAGSGAAAPAMPGAPEVGGSTWTTTKIQAQYFADADVKGRDIDVTTRNGVVTLSGRVDTEAQRQKAVQIARQTEGVTDVQDRLQVTPEAGGAATPAAGGERLTDAQVTARVQSRFYQDDDLRRSSIDVRSESGVVTLGGTVPSESRKRQAASLARGVDGVTEVRDELRVDPTVPNLPDARGARGTREASSDVNDAWITTRIQARFYLDPDIKGRHVDVTTQNGVVTLTGAVDNDAMKQQAMAIAKETDDVVRVVDKLTIRSQGAAR
jgi:osmotically-inducible protein OsmY